MQRARAAHVHELLVVVQVEAVEVGALAPLDLRDAHDLALQHFQRLARARLDDVTGQAFAPVRQRRQVGLRSGELKLRTGLDDPPELSLPFSCRVAGTLAVEPSNPYFDLLAAGGQKVVLTVKSSQPNFRLLAADVLDGPFSASFSGQPGGPYRVELSFLAEHAPAEARGASGHVRLRTTDRSEPERTLDLFALGRAAAAP